MFWRERAPEVWDTGEPYLDLALAVTLRAQQDVMEAARYGVTVLDESVLTEKRRKAYRAMMWRKPESALWYFAKSPFWARTLRVDEDGRDTTSEGGHPTRPKDAKSRRRTCLSSAAIRRGSENGVGPVGETRPAFSCDSGEPYLLSFVVGFTSDRAAFMPRFQHPPAKAPDKSNPRPRIGDLMGARQDKLLCVSRRASS